MPNAKEVATISIDGSTFKDWEKIAVHVEFPGQFRGFAASISEQSPSAKTMAAAQIKLGAFCEVALGGSPVFSGYVYERQMSLDANTHAVQISARGVASDTIRTSIDFKKLGNGGEFVDQTIKQIATKVLEPWKITPVFRGDSENFNKKVTDNIQQGESAFHFLERLCRRLEIFIGDDNKGNYVFYGGLLQKGSGASGAALIEGKNIKYIQAVINDEAIMSDQVCLTQACGDDKNWGKAINTAEVRQGGSATRYKPYVFQIERGVPPNSYKQEIKDRLDFEVSWREGTKITATVGVQGWFKSGGSLWEPGVDQLVEVHSPSAMITEALAIRTITFSQSNDEGTMTALGLVLPQFYGGEGQVDLMKR